MFQQRDQRRVKLPLLLDEEWAYVAVCPFVFVFVMIHSEACRKTPVMA